MANCSFKYYGLENSSPITIEIEPFTIGFASKTLQEKLGVNLLNVFDGNNLEGLITQILLNDEFALKCWWFFVDKKLQTLDPASAYDKAIDTLTPIQLGEFKDAFWAAIISFFDPIRREMLIQTRAGFKEILLKSLKDQMKGILDSSSTSSQQKPDSLEETSILSP